MLSYHSATFDDIRTYRHSDAVKDYWVQRITEITGREPIIGGIWPNWQFQIEEMEFAKQCFAACVLALES